MTASADNYYAGSQLIETDVSDGTVYQYVWSARAADPILRDTIAGRTRSKSASSCLLNMLPLPPSSRFPSLPPPPRNGRAGYPLAA